MGRGAKAGRSHATSYRWLLAVIAATLMLLLTAFGLLIQDSQSAAHEDLDERFLNRATLTAGFTRDYVGDIATRERTQAERLLAGPDVDRATFEQVVLSFSFEAAVLLDGQGRLVHSWPRRPELTGRDMASEHPYLAAALAGSVGVSPAVRSGADGPPVAAVATSFDGGNGRRVLSGAFSLATTPLRGYVGEMASVAGGHGYLVDQAGNVVKGEDGAAEVPEGLLVLPTGIAHVDTGQGPFTVATVRIDGMPWRVVLAVPTAAWYGPVHAVRWAWALLAAVAVAGILVLILVVWLVRARGQAALSARTDTLTGLPNRRAMDEMLLRSVAHAGRRANPLAVLMIDIDHFKTVNDIHGHATGDLLLKKTAEVLGEVGRDEDMAGRWGGEEFLVVLQATGIDGAVAAAERLRRAIARIEVTAGRATVRVTASIGVAVLAEGGTPDTLLRAADTALYRAKANGRDAVEVARVLGVEPIHLAPGLAASGAPSPS